MIREFFILWMLFFLSVIVLSNTYGQTPLNKTLNNAPTKFNENIPKEKLKPTVKSREFRNMDFEAIKLVKSREFRNMDFEAIKLVKSREFRDMDFEAIKLVKSREFRDMDFEAIKLVKSREFRDMDFIAVKILDLQRK